MQFSSLKSKDGFSVLWTVLEEILLPVSDFSTMDSESIMLPLREIGDSCYTFFILKVNFCIVTYFKVGMKLNCNLFCLCDK